MGLTDRRKWYIGFGIFILAVLALLFLFHASIYWAIGFIVILAFIGIYDKTQKRHSILRNFPILGHMRFILEFFRPEVQQYFIADDQSERPFDRETRSIIYERSKGVNDTLAYGTERNILENGYEWITHSMSPKHVSEVENRIDIGGKDCIQKYSASRLNISAMSFGALSANAIKALNLGAKLGDFYHNTGEGSLSDHHKQGGDIVYQVGTGYFGCRSKSGGFSDEVFKETASLDIVKMIEIKISQGAKPAHGGVLPAAKITPEIARIRNVRMDEDVLSPPAHEKFSSPLELCYFIKELRDLSKGKPVGFKLCIGKKVDFLGICKAMLQTKILPDFITVDGAEGGTGAAPMEYVNHVGIPLNDGLAFVHNALTGCGLREDIRIIASGKITSGFDMVRKVALGADICNSARGMMMSLGCIQSRQCNHNTCPVGVATQNPKLYSAIDINDKKYRVNRFHAATVHSFQELIGAMGLINPSDLCPSMIHRRISQSETRQYDEIYRFIPKGSLLNEDTIPDIYKKYWNTAKAETFEKLY
jgi:glutamate synthase domain-containing protein 2